LTDTAPASPNLSIPVARVIRSNASQGTILAHPADFRPGVLSVDSLRLEGNLEVLGTTDLQALTCTTIDTGNGATEINTAASKGVTGSDANAVTGTAGTAGNLLEWNADGDAVDSGKVADNVLQGTAGTSGNLSEWDASGNLIDSGHSIDQDLNTTDDVDFNSVTADSFAVNFIGPETNSLDAVNIGGEAVSPAMTVGERAGPLSSYTTTITDTLDVTGALICLNINTGNGPFEIDEAASKGVTGSDANAVTGTAGTSGNLAEWNGDGDLIDSGHSINQSLNTTDDVDFNSVTLGGGTDALDTYEEGTFTPALEGQTTAGTNSYSGTPLGVYRRVGGVVVVSLQIFLDGTSGALDSTGNLLISGLPFVGTAPNTGVSIGRATGISLSSGEVIAGFVDVSNSQVRLQKSSNTGLSNLTDSDVGDSFSIRVSFEYLI